MSWKLVNKDKTPTRAGFACGYIQKWEDGDNRLSLGMEHQTFHIKGIVDGKQVWETAQTVKEARQKYANEIKKAKSLKK